MQDDPSYRPKLRFLEYNGAASFSTNSAATDLSILEGSLVGGSYGPAQARFEEASMQACVGVLQKARVEPPAPDAGPSDDPGNQPYQAAFQACPDMAIVRAWIEAAGRDLNYGTLERAIDGLTVDVPGEPDPLVFGPPPAADGNPTAYLFAWDPANKQFVIQSS
jgi:hypothetical protein